MAGNKSLRRANRAKEDEFYTKLTDIEKELSHYKDNFRDKIVFCNCDDPEHSNFWKYFELNFKHLGLKKLIATHYDDEKSTYKLELSANIDGDGTITEKDIIKTSLKQNGDFRSSECIEILKEVDIVVTNPPFSLFREYITQLIEYNKKFIVIGNQNAFTYKEIFEFMRTDKLWVGYGYGDMEFKVPNYYKPRKTRFRIDENGQKWRSLGNICWFTNLDIEKRHEDIILYKKYNEEEYLKFDNFNAINIDKVKDIPCDYYELMAVPITFMNKYNPNQFEIIDALNRYSILDTQGNNENVRKRHSHMCNIDGKPKYFRIVIKRREN